MKTTRNIVLALSLLGSAAGVASAQPSISAGIHLGSSGRASVDLGFFYDNLASYGNWIERPSYGWVWTPNQVSSNWRPYQDGHWVWTDEGWTWISEEPYGWATYHYGRWYEDPEIGWSWVPGDEWAPAWVDWQEGDNYVGWAPLPPSYDINAGYGGGYRLAPEAYVFVPERNFLSVSIGAYIVPQVQVVSFFGRTRNYTSYRHNGDRVYNQGVPIDRIQRVVGRTVPRYQIADLGAEGYRQRGARIQGNQVQIFRPQVQRSSQVTPPASRPTARRAVVSAQQFQASHPNRAQRQGQGQDRGQMQGQGQVQGQRQVDPYNRQRSQDPNQNGQNGRQRTYGTQRPGQVQAPDQSQADRQRQYGNNQPRGYQPQARPQVQNNGRQQQQPPADQQAQQDRANRQRQYNTQPRDRSQAQDPNNRQRPPQQTDRQYQRPPQAQPQRQVQPQQQQPPSDRNNGETRGQQAPKDNQNAKARQQQQDRRNRQQHQDDNQDPNRPPGRR
jgi:hypothetical protein